MNLILKLFICSLITNLAYAANITSQDREACQSGVRAMVFFKFKHLIALKDSERMKAATKPGAQPNPRMSYVNKSDCAAISSSMEAEKAKIQRLSQACTTMQTVEQFRKMYSEDMDMGIRADEDPKQFISHAVDALAGDECPASQAIARETSRKTMNFGNMVECCEISMDALKKMYGAWSQCQNAATPATPPPAADTCEIAESDGLCKNSKVRGAATPAPLSTPSRMSDFEILKANCLEFGANGGCIRTRSSGAVGR